MSRASHPPQGRVSEADTQRTPPGLEQHWRLRPGPAPPAAVHTHSQGKAVAAGAGRKGMARGVTPLALTGFRSMRAMTFWGQNYMQCLRLDFKAGSAPNCPLGACGQLKHQLCARSFWNTEITAPCDRRVLSPGCGSCPLTQNGVSPCTKLPGVPLHLLLGSSWETKPREGLWSPTAAGCKQKEGQKDQGHPPAAQGQHEPPDLGWLSYTGPSCAGVCLR